MPTTIEVPARTLTTIQVCPCCSEHHPITQGITVYTRSFTCERCGNEWIDEWCSDCDDRCPSCNLSCSGECTSEETIVESVN